MNFFCMLFGFSSLLLFNGLIFSASSSKPIIKTSVIILGAGASGMAAAKSLTTLGIKDFAIIEGRPQVGGRMTNINWPPNIPGNTIETGANWIHGVRNNASTPGKMSNPVWMLAEYYNISRAPTTYEDYVVYTDRGKFDALEFKRAEAKFLKAMDAIRIYAGKRRQKKMVDIDVRSALKMYGWKQRNQEDINATISQVVEYRVFDFDYADSPDHTSLIYAIDDSTFPTFGEDTEFINDPRGYKYMFEQELRLLLEANGKQSSLYLNTTVEKITYADKLHRDTGGVVIETSNGIFKADYAICTFSLGVLQDLDNELFMPRPPPWKIEAIQRFRMGVYSKIFFSFPKRFWDENEFIYYADDRRGYYPIWQNMDPGNHTDSKPILFVTLTGDEAKRVEKLTDDQIINEAMSVLKSIYKDSFLAPDHIYVPRWHNDEFFRGSYSNWPVGDMLEHFANLQAPLSSLEYQVLHSTGESTLLLGDEDNDDMGLQRRAHHQRVWFAGEHCSKEFFGYVHGAWLNGLEVGSDVAKCVLNNGLCETKLVYKNIHSCKQKRN